MFQRLAIAGILATSVTIGSCEESNSPFIPTPETTADARLISMVLGQTIRPDEWLAARVARELSAIRGKYGTEIPEVLSLHPQPPWKENVIWLWMTEEAADSVRRGVYSSWDSLNGEQGASVLKISSTNPWVFLVFDDLIHPRFMGELYAGLPGVTQVRPNRAIGDWPNLYPLQREEGRTYLFRAAGGDCLAGCGWSEYWYFRFAGAQPEFVGHWRRPGDPEPAWWAEAKENTEFLYDW